MPQEQETGSGLAVPPVLIRMLALWNEQDLSRIRGEIDEIFSPDVIFIDPDNHVVGRDAFEAMVKTFRTRLPRAVCSRSSGVDGHHDLHRYHWEIHQDGQRIIEGFDVVKVDASGLVSRVEGFFGAVPRR